ncbi:MAG TPA: DUF1552 domain-containing protein [Steroidobacteraceae bacterium]|nr:DUF1552 domain-containing protein [Steroidobacteraceae bacterium]
MFFLTNKKLPRRTFLRGLGTTLALPLLESMLPTRGAVAAQKQIVPTRFLGAFVPHGIAPGHWIPESTAPGFAYPYVYEPLQPFRKHVVLTSGMWSKSSENPPGVTGADHFVAAAFLTCQKPKKTTGADIEVGTSVDQVIAAKIGTENLLPSVQLAVEDPGANSSNCGEGYSCVYTNTISWETPTRPLPMEINPQTLFERMFGDGSSPQMRKMRRERQSSILDSVNGSLRDIMAQVPHGDQMRLEQYADDVREVERRLSIAARASTDAPNMTMPYGVPESFHEHIQVQWDLLALAYQTDITRVATMLFARDLTSRTFPESGTNSSFHGVSHHAEDPGQIALLAKINRYHVQMLAYLVQKLDSIPEGDGTVLDHSLILFGSNMGNSNQHLHYDTPAVLIGGASGRLKGDRYLPYASRTVPTGNLMLSILGMFDVQAERFGDSTGPLQNI